MSRKSNPDKKIEVEESADSGYISGLIVESGDLSEQLSNLAISGAPQSDNNKNVGSDSSIQLDSGLCMDSSSGLVKTEISTEIPKVTVEPVLDPRTLIPILLEQDEDGDTQLHIAAVHGCQRTTSALLRICPDKAWINLPNDHRHTALHLAVMSKHATVARMLLIAGASLEARDLAGQTPLHIATELQSIQCLHALLTPLSSTTRMPGKKQTNHVLDETNYDGQTCVHLAANAGNIDVLRTLMHYGADINAKEHHGGWTALHVAARRADVPLIRFLLGASGLRPHARDYARRTARRLARRTSTEHAFANLPPDDEDESDTDDDDDDDEEMDNLFEVMMKGGLSPRMTPVA